MGKYNTYKIRVKKTSKGDVSRNVDDVLVEMYLRNNQTTEGLGRVLSIDYSYAEGNVYTERRWEKLVEHLIATAKNAPGFDFWVYALEIASARFNKYTIICGVFSESPGDIVFQDGSRYGW